MHATFPFRRQDILENMLTFNELLLTYPPLQDPNEVKTVAFNVPIFFPSTAWS